jgi:sigma-B regulation protein RsbU (phosphoserine phosphatase)
MSLMLLKLKNGYVTYSSAGMPPIFIYRYKRKQIEEHVVKGMPLGAFDSFSYKVFETQLERGDTLLLMSDGFPELFNEKNEILDTNRIKEIFAEIAEKPSNEIVSYLFTSGDEWRKNRPLHDDVTFIVCKIKP